MKLPLVVKDTLYFIGLKVFKVSLNLSKEREFPGLVNTVVVSKSCKPVGSVCLSSFMAIYEKSVLFSCFIWVNALKD